MYSICTIFEGVTSEKAGVSIYGCGGLVSQCSCRLVVSIFREIFAYQSTIQEWECEFWVNSIPLSKAAYELYFAVNK
jgi:hypothetical protein